MSLASLLQVETRTPKFSVGPWIAMVGCLTAGVLAVELVAPAGRLDAGERGPSVVGQLPGDEVELYDRLTVVLKPRLDSEKQFIDLVVVRVNEGRLPMPMVNAAFNYARNKQPYPMPYFREALLRIAAVGGVTLE